METKVTVKAKTQMKYLNIEKYSRILFCLIAWILLLCIVIQVSLAGLSNFVNDEIWVKHQAFIFVFEFVPWILYVLGCAAGIPRNLNILNVVLFLLINFQYYTPNVWGGAIHIVFALVLMMISLSLAWRSQKFVVRARKKVYI